MALLARPVGRVGAVPADRLARVVRHGVRLGALKTPPERGGRRALLQRDARRPDGLKPVRAPHAEPVVQARLAPVGTRHARPRREELRRPTPSAGRNARRVTRWHHAGVVLEHEGVVADKAFGRAGRSVPLTEGAVLWAPLASGGVWADKEPVKTPQAGRVDGGATPRMVRGACPV